MNEPWEHLQQYGYAPGHYMNKCRNCQKICHDVDKRATSCRACAEQRHLAVRTVASLRKDKSMPELSGIPGTLPPLPEPAAHMYPSDLERFQTNETFAQAYSVAVGNPDERSVPLMTLADTVAYAAAAVAMEREKWESLCRAQGFLYMIEKRAKMK